MDARKVDVIKIENGEPRKVKSIWIPIAINHDLEKGIAELHCGDKLVATNEYLYGITSCAPLGQRHKPT